MLIDLVINQLMKMLAKEPVLIMFKGYKLYLFTKKEELPTKKEGK